MPDKIGPTFRDLIAHEDEEFIKAAYRAILGRPPAPREGPLTELRGGMRKSSILRALSNSEEGRARNARIPGLRIHSAIEAAQSIPIVGHVAALFFDLLNFPALAGQIVATHRLVRQIHADIEALRHINESPPDTRGLEDRVAAMTMEMACLLDVKHQRLQAQMAEMSETLAEIKASLADAAPPTASTE